MSKHKTLENRITISNGLNARQSFAEIGKLIGKAAGSVSREIKNHRIVSDKSGYGRIPNRCIHR